MAPRDSRAKSHTSKVKDVVVNHSFVKSGLRVLSEVRQVKVRDRLCSTEFEERPDPDAIPLYGVLIKDPVALKDLENGLRSGVISTADGLAGRFTRMVKNAKSFNRPGSTIYKDANRLFHCFQTAMKKELNFVVEDDEDVDEEEAWSRDLKERPQLAAYERDQYHEVQLKVEKARSGKTKTPKQLAAERELDLFIDARLEVVTCRDPANIKKELNGDELRQALSTLKLVKDKRDYAAVTHTPSMCMTCGTFGQEESDHSEPACQRLPGSTVVTPKYHIIAPPDKKPTTPRPTVPALLPTSIEPVSSRKTVKRSFQSLDVKEVIANAKVAKVASQGLRTRQRRSVSRS